jgi:outer membrane lipopolysaccharide assembly protein LptE/RlpB
MVDQEVLAQELQEVAKPQLVAHLVAVQLDQEGKLQDEVQADK